MASLCCADPQLHLGDHQSPGSNRGACVSPAARERYRDSCQPHPGGRRYVTMAYNPSLRYCCDCSRDIVMHQWDTLIRAFFAGCALQLS